MEKMYTYVEKIWRGNLALEEEMRITNSHVCIPSAALVLKAYAHIKVLHWHSP